MKKIRSSIVFIGLIFIFQEVVFRICFPIPEVSNFNRVNYQVLDNDKYHDPDLFLENRTWQSSLDTDYVFVHRFNEYGFRDGSWPIEKQQDQKRILFIGDSFVEGVMADDDNSIPAYYQKMVGDSYEVMNAGMNGTGMSSYLKLMADMIPLFKPDEVKLILFSNDFSSQKTRAFKPLIPEFSNPYSPRLVEIIKRLMENKQIVFRGYRKTFPFLFPIPDQSNPFSTQAHELAKEVTPEVKKAMENATMNYYMVNLLEKQGTGLTKPISFEDELKIIKELCQKNDATLSVYYLPARNQITDKYLKYDKMSCLQSCANQNSLSTEEFQLHAKILKEDCRFLAIQFHDLSPALAKKEQLDKLHWNYDEHMKNIGYKFIANEILTNESRIEAN